MGGPHGRGDHVGRRRRRSGLEPGRAPGRLPAVRARARRPALAADRVPGPLRFGRPVRVRAGLRHRPGQHHARPHPARRPRPGGPDRRADRLVPGSSHRLRLLREPRRREARLHRLQRRQPGRLVGRGVGRRHADRLAGLDGGVPDPALAAPLRVGRAAHLRIRRAPLDRALSGGHRLAALLPHHPGRDVAARHAGGPRGAGVLEPNRAHPLRRHEERHAGLLGRRVRAPPGALGGRGPQGRAHPQRDARRHREPRLRPGRGGPGGGEPERFRDLLPGAAALLRGRDGALSVQAQLLHRRRLQLQRGALLLAPYRPEPLAARRIR